MILDNAVLEVTVWSPGGVRTGPRPPESPSFQARAQLIRQADSDEHRTRGVEELGVGKLADEKIPGATVRNRRNGCSLHD